MLFDAALLQFASSSSTEGSALHRVASKMLWFKDAQFCACLYASFSRVAEIEARLEAQQSLCPPPASLNPPSADALRDTLACLLRAATAPSMSSATVAISTATAAAAADITGCEALQRSLPASGAARPGSLPSSAGGAFPEGWRSRPCLGVGGITCASAALLGPFILTSALLVLRQLRVLYQSDGGRSADGWTGGRQGAFVMQLEATVSPLPWRSLRPLAHPPPRRPGPGPRRAGISSEP